MKLRSKFFTCINSGKYVCKVAASMIEPGTRIESFNGNHEEGKSNNDVQYLIFGHTTVHYILRGIEEIFPRLVRLIIYNCGLKSIKRQDLHGLEQLELLQLTRNALKSLPVDLFVGLTKLHEIDFARNQVQFMSSKLLEPIEDNGLENVDLRSNAKIDYFYHKNLLGSLKDLMEEIDRKCSPVEFRKDDRKSQAHDSCFQKLAVYQKMGKFSSQSKSAKKISKCTK